MRWHVGFGCALILLLAAPVAGLAQYGRGHIRKLQSAEFESARR